jgi:hypothetical protein
VKQGLGPSAPSIRLREISKDLTLPSGLASSSSPRFEEMAGCELSEFKTASRKSQQARAFFANNNFAPGNAAV